MKVNNVKTALFQSVNRYVIGLFFIIFVWLLSACNPVFELQITVQDQPRPVLGKVAYISGGDVWIDDLDNDRTMRLTLDGYNSHPQWSADGSQIAFLKKNQLWVIDIVSHHVMTVSETPVEWFEWSPTESILVYFIGNAGLYSWDVNPQTDRLILPITSGNALESFVWDDKESIVYTNGSIKNGMYWLSINRLNVRDEVVETLNETSEMREIPRLASVSADGKWIAYWLWNTQITFPEQEGLLLCTLGVADKQNRCMDSKSIPSTDFLDWSSENRITFISSTAEENRFKNSLVIADSLEFKEKSLVEFGADQLSIHPAWAPDGNSIAYSGVPINQQKTSEGYEQNGAAICHRRIWVVDTESKKNHQLTNDERYCDDIPEWSTDGEYILFSRVNKNNASLWLMKSNGKDLHQIVPELTPKPEPLGKYGIINWANWWDWWLPSTS
jgi:Tol biopolymer transport system component